MRAHDWLRPPRATLPAQQRAFDTFRREYNEVRPHDTLAGRTPASVCQPSPRPYPRRLPPIDYDVGLDEVEDGIWSIYFCDVLIARFDERDHVIRS